MSANNASMNLSKKNNSMKNNFMAINVMKKNNTMKNNNKNKNVVNVASVSVNTMKKNNASMNVTSMKNTVAVNAMGGRRKNKSKTRKLSKGASNWQHSVMKVYKEMKAKDKNVRLRDAMKEASRRKKKGQL